MKISVNEVLKESFELFKKNFPALILLAVLAEAGLAAKALLAADESHLKTVLIDNLLYYVIFFWGFLAMLYYTRGLYFGVKITIKEAIGLSMEKYPVFLLVMSIVFTASMLGFIALVIPGIYISIIWAAADAVTAFENRKPVECLKESKFLVDGNFWPVLGVVAVLTVLALMLAGIFDSMARMAEAKWEFSGHVMKIIKYTGESLAEIITMPLFAASTVILYTKLRKIKYGNRKKP